MPVRSRSGSTWPWLRVFLVSVVTAGLVAVGIAGALGDGPSLHSRSGVAGHGPARGSRLLTPGGAVATAASPVSDDFGASSINSRLWTFINPAGSASASDNGSQAVITVPGGVAQPAASSEQAPALLQPVTNGDFSVQLKFGSEVTSPYQEQGFLAYQDASDFIHFYISYSGTQAYVGAAATVGGVVTQDATMAVRNGANFYLRVIRSSNTWTWSYSYDGQAWTAMGSFSVYLTVTKVGPYAGTTYETSGANARSFTSLVDYFHNIAGATYTTPPHINLWYGNRETFGQIGEPQAYINVLGNVSDPAGMASLSYTLNGGQLQPLTMGENDFRLSAPGDFNADIPYSALQHGNNTVVITALDDAGLRSTQTVIVTDAYHGQSWPGNYSINWSKDPDIESVAQVVDGHWGVEPNGTVRTLTPGYDRLIDLGDMTSWTDYQATVDVTINSLPANGGPFGVGPIFGWQGHTSSHDGQQPMDGHPFDAWFNYASGGQGEPQGLSIYANSAHYSERGLVSDTSGLRLNPGTTYEFKMQAVTNAGGATSTYSLKVWPKGTPEPSTWLLRGTGDHNQGSLLLASYAADVSFGNVTVTSLASSASQPVNTSPPF